VPRLALGADEQHVLAGRDRLRDQPLGQQQAFERFLHIDDVNHVALAVDVRRHLRVPPRYAVAEVHARVDERFDEVCLRLLSHDHSKSLRVPGAARIPARRQPEQKRAGQDAARPP
jgi:hypothetical protein